MIYLQPAYLLAYRTLAVPGVAQRCYAMMMPNTNCRQLRLALLLQEILIVVLNDTFPLDALLYMHCTEMSQSCIHTVLFRD